MFSTIAVLKNFRNFAPNFPNKHKTVLLHLIFMSYYATKNLCLAIRQYRSCLQYAVPVYSIHGMEVIFLFHTSYTLNSYLKIVHVNIKLKGRIR